MANYSPNPDAPRNIRVGENAFLDGLRDPEAVLRAHLADAHGTCAGYHFAYGYREAAARAGVKLGDSLRFFPFGGLEPADRLREAEIICEEQIKRYGHAPMQWQLDRLRAAAKP